LNLNLEPRDSFLGADSHKVARLTAYLGGYPNTKAIILR
jgi:hypothetical protein